VNAFLKTVNDTMNLAERVEYLASYLPQLALEIEAETDKVQKERLKILYVL
jgi:hypothetical protein